MARFDDYSADPATLKKQLPRVATRADLAAILDVSVGLLNHVLYARGPDSYYKSWEISKKSGGVRTISAPNSSLYLLQARLNRILQAAYEPKACVQGFVHERSTVTNASRHVGKRHVLNLDIADFFPSLNFGRVRGVLLAPPFQLSEEVATAIAQMACFNGALPIGGPTSPVLANMICMRMDGALMRLASSQSCWYTRYADDLTFSTNRRAFPDDLATYSKSDGTTIGQSLSEVIENNGFQIHAGKSRLLSSPARQEVTGLVVNHRVNVDRKYIRRVRAMLHSLETQGLRGAQAKFEEVDQKDRWPGSTPRFADVLHGMVSYIGMVRGSEDELYIRLRAQLRNLLAGKPRLEGVPIPSAAYPDMQTLTIVFTDIEGSSSLAEALGDPAWMEVLSRHYALIMDATEWAGGEVVKTLGDGAMLAFSSALGAAKAAQRIQSHISKAPELSSLSIRIGVHTGDVVHVENDYVGTAANTAQRVSDEADGGEILISAPARALLVGTEWRFGTERRVELKGLEGAHLLAPLLWQEPRSVEPLAKNQTLTSRLRRLLRRLFQ